MQTFIITMPSDSTKMLSTEYSFGPLCLSDNMDIALKFRTEAAAEHLLKSVRTFRTKKGQLTWDEVNVLNVIEI